MAKFKKGDRIIHPKKGKGTVVGIIPDDKSVGVKYDTWHKGHSLGFDREIEKFANTTDQGWYEHEDNIKLLTEYTPITPRVGEKYRVLKEFMSGDKKDRTYPVGVELMVVDIEKDDRPVKFTHNQIDGWDFTWLYKDFLTTEYLELVEEPRYMRAKFEIEPVFATIKPGQIIKADLKDISVTPEPIKKTIIQKTMNAFKKALLSADTKTLIKAGYMDSETLELTSKGQDALNFIVYEKYQKELVAAAAADIAEAEAKKK